MHTYQSIKHLMYSGALTTIALVEGDFLAVGNQARVDKAEFAFKPLLANCQPGHRTTKSKSARNTTRWNTMKTFNLVDKDCRLNIRHLMFRDIEHKWKHTDPPPRSRELARNSWSRVEHREQSSVVMDSPSQLKWTKCTLLARCRISVLLTMGGNTTSISQYLDFNISFQQNYIGKWVICSKFDTKPVLKVLQRILQLKSSSLSSCVPRHLSEQ